METKHYDVVIVGGSYAGLSAAITLGRSLRHTLVIDNKNPGNRVAPHAQNLLPLDGVPPAEIRAQCLAQLEKYETVSFLNTTATAARDTGNGIEITVGEGDTYNSKALLIATGVTFDFPYIEGLDACWGKSVLHCPYCHGYEFKDKATGLLLTKENFGHYASLLKNLSNDLVLITDGQETLTEKQQTFVEDLGMSVYTSPIRTLIHEDGYLSGIKFTDDTKCELKALYAAFTPLYHNELAVLLGCEIGDHGHIKRNGAHKTNVPGVYACGDVSGATRTLAVAMASGNIAGMTINSDLCKQDFKH